jgi:hypothetical protein
MKQNMASWHRAVYIAGGGGLAAWALSQEPLRWFAAAVGIIGVIEGLVGR